MKTLNEYIKESILDNEEVLSRNLKKDANNPFVIIKNMFESHESMNDIAEIIIKDIFPTLKFIFSDPNISDEDIFIGGNEGTDTLGHEFRILSLYHKKGKSNDLAKGFMRLEYTSDYGYTIWITSWPNIASGTKRMLDNKKFKMLKKTLIDKFNLKDGGEGVLKLK